MSRVYNSLFVAFTAFLSATACNTLDLTPLTAIRGELVHRERIEVTSEVVIIWRSYDFEVGETVVRTGMTPLDFELNLDAAPPTVFVDSIHTATGWVSPEVPIAEASILAVRVDALDDPEALKRIVDGYEYEEVQGYLAGYGLTYLPEDVPAGSRLEHYLCGALPAGYHLMAGELAQYGDWADCPQFPGGSEYNGAMWSKVDNEVAEHLSIELCQDEFLACSK